RRTVAARPRGLARRHRVDAGDRPHGRSRSGDRLARPPARPGLVRRHLQAPGISTDLLSGLAAHGAISAFAHSCVTATACALRIMLLGGMGRGRSRQGRSLVGRFCVSKGISLLREESCAKALIGSLFLALVIGEEARAEDPPSLILIDGVVLTMDKSDRVAQA